MMYKMTDLINTIVSRTLYNADYEMTLSADEAELLRLYDQSHFADMLNDVIDILKNRIGGKKYACNSDRTQG